MSDETTDQVLQLAQQRIAARREQERLQAERNPRPALGSARTWRYAFGSTMGMLLLALLFTPGLPLEQKMIVVMQGLCAQEHNIILGGIQFPICARCSGIYISFVITLVYAALRGRGRAARLPSWYITGLLGGFVAVMAIDGINSTFDQIGITLLYPPHNTLRVLSGIGLGVAMAVFVQIVFNQAMRRDVDEHLPPLRDWRDLGAVLVLNFLVMTAIFGNLHFLAWPLAGLAFFGMLFVLFIVNLMLISLVIGYGGTISRLPDLAFPALLALLPTGVLVTGMALLRSWMEAQGMMP